MSGSRSSVARTVSGVTVWSMCSASSTSGCIQTGVAPDMISPPIALLCELRGIAILSPGLSAAIIMHWLPLVEPLIRKNDCSAPKHAAASSCASTSASSGCSRSSRPRICVRSIASTLSPTKSRNARSIPMPCLWPGVWNGMTPAST